MCLVFVFSLKLVIRSKFHIRICILIAFNIPIWLINIVPFLVSLSTFVILVIRCDSKFVQSIYKSWFKVWRRPIENDEFRLALELNITACVTYSPRCLFNLGEGFRCALRTAILRISSCSFYCSRNQSLDHDLKYVQMMWAMELKSQFIRKTHV